MTAQDIFKRYDSPEQYAEAFQQMIDARERWREQVREQEAKSVQWNYLRTHSICARPTICYNWFYDYARSHEMTLYSDSVTFKKVSYYAGILMRHEHPLHDIILSYFQDFLKHVPQLYTPREK